MIGELPETYLVRLGDVVRFSGLSRPTVMRLLRKERRRVPMIVPRGMRRAYYRREDVMALFGDAGRER